MKTEKLSQTIGVKMENQLPRSILTETKELIAESFKEYYPLLTFLVLVGLISIVVSMFLISPDVLAASIPGDDKSGELKAAGTLLKLLDTGIFKWGARVFAGICIMSAGWALKEQMFGTAAICVVGAITFGTAPTWVHNIFSVGDNQGLFSSINYLELKHLVLAKCNLMELVNHV